jgi:hypothetical protein
MTTPKTPVPAASQPGLSPASIAEAGDGLIRLWIAVIKLPLTAANAIGASLSRLINSTTTALDGNALPQGSNDIVKATSDLVGASAKLYLALLNATVSSLDAATRAIDAAAKETSAPPRK